MAKKTTAFAQEYAFYEQLWTFYVENRGRGCHGGIGAEGHDTGKADICR